MLEEDGTEVDEEEYFQFIPDRTLLIVMSRKGILISDWLIKY